MNHPLVVGYIFVDQNISRPEVLWKLGVDQIDTFHKLVSNERDYEAQYAYGNEIFNDFNFNVGRKIHILKSVIKVQLNILWILIIYLLDRCGHV